VWIGKSTFRVSLLALTSGYTTALFYSEDGGEISFRNAGNYLADYTVSHLGEL
jgi:hypothetical protein